MTTVATNKFKTAGGEDFALDLHGVTLKGWDWSNTRLVSANFQKANLQKADLSNAQLANADFSGADLTGANFRDACLDGASFVGASLYHAIFTGASLVGTDFSGAILRGADLRGVDISTAVNISGWSIIEAVFDDTTILSEEVVKDAEAAIIRRDEIEASAKAVPSFGRPPGLSDSDG